MKQKKGKVKYQEFEIYKVRIKDFYEHKSLHTFKREVKKYEIPEKVYNYWIEEEGWVPKKPGKKPSTAKQITMATIAQAETNGIFDLKESYGISDEEFSVCMEYIKQPNWERAYKRVHVGKVTPQDVFVFRHDERIKNFVKEVQKRFIENIVVDADRLLDELNAIAFADMGDLVNFSGDEVKIRPGSTLDTRMIKKISQNREGVTVELHNKLDAIHTLLKYAGVPNPAKSKEGKTVLRTVEQAQNDERLKLAWDKFEFEKSLEQGGGFEAPDDGFLEAINKASKGAFDDETDKYGDPDPDDEDDDE